MRLIDYEALEKETAQKTMETLLEGKFLKAYGYLIDALIDAPTVDAVPVTRCRDCTRHRVEVINGAECWRCPLRELDVGPDYYCADGVRE